MNKRLHRAELIRPTQTFFGRRCAKHFGRFEGVSRKIKGGLGVETINKQKLLKDYLTTRRDELIAANRLDVANELEIVLLDFADTLDSPSIQDEWKQEWAAMSNLLLERTKEHTQESDRLREANKLLEAERDEHKSAREYYYTRMCEAEKERDIAVKALTEIFQQENLIHGEDTVASNLAETALSEIRRSTDAPKDTNGLS